MRGDVVCRDTSVEVTATNQELSRSQLEIITQGSMRIGKIFGRERALVCELIQEWHSRIPDHLAIGMIFLDYQRDMPVIWTKYYGKGKVYYNSLGHQANIVDSEPNLTLMRRGFLWAAK